MDHVLLLFGLVLLTAGVTVGGVLLHEPGWFLGVFGGLLLLLVLGEGAYRVYEADARPPVAESGSTVADRIEGFAREYDLLRREVPAAPVPDDVCLLYTSPSPRDRTRSRMPSSA